MTGSDLPWGGDKQSDMQAMIDSYAATVNTTYVRFLKELEVLPAEPCHTGDPGELAEALNDHPGRFVDWATLEARARAEQDRLQKELEVLSIELLRTWDPGELNKALREYPVLFAKWAALEAGARADHRELTWNLEVLDAQLLDQYQDRLIKEARSRGAIEPTPDAIKAEVLLDEKRLALAKTVREAGSALEQVVVACTAIKQRSDSLRKLGAIWRAEMDSRPVVPRNFPPAEPDSAPTVTDTDDRGIQGEKVGYLATDNLPKFREYMDLLRQDVFLWERQHEQALVEAAFRKSQMPNEPPAEAESRRETQADFRRDLDKGFARMFELFLPGTVFGDLLIVSTPPISYEAVADRVRQLGQQLQVRYGGGPEPWAELVAQITSALARSPVPSPGRAPGDDVRLAAAGRIVDLIGHAIHRTRWSWIKKVLDELAKLHGQDADAELRRALVANLFEAVEVAGEYTLAEEAEVRRALRARLNKLATVDLLGPGWRRARHEVDPEEARREIEERQLDHSEPKRRKVERAKPEQRETEQRDVEPKRAGPVVRNMVASTAARAKASLEAEIVGRLESERLIAAAKLTDREAEIVSEVARLGGEHGAAQAAAQKLGIAPATARVLLSTARKKLAAARKKLTATDR